MSKMFPTKTPKYVPAPPANATPADVLAPYMAAWQRERNNASYQEGRAMGSRAGATTVLIGGLIVAACYAMAVHWNLGV